MTQQEALDILKLGHNVYLTGPAGSGKTFLLNKYINFLKGKNIGVGITASTGIAATHMNGRTIHSWAGLGIQNEITDDHLSKLLKNINFRARFLKTKVLIIDEVSMLHSFRLDMVDKVCKAFKKNDLPFGGLQVILSGDFFQLPPVSKNGEDDSFIHTSKAWENMNIKICYLTEQYRQQDLNFLNVLNDIRAGKTSDTSLGLLTSRFNKPAVTNITPTKLYTHNVDVDAINNFELNKIESEPKTYKMQCRGEKYLVESLKKGCLAPEELTLKKDAVVMFVKNNFDKGYVNGTLGKVIDFDGDSYPIIKTIKGKEVAARPTSWTVEENDLIKAEISQVPLRLAWAITVHKSQGMSLDAAEIDLSKSFTYGMGYVALSRVRTLNGIKLMGLNDLALQVDNTVIDLDKQLYKISQSVVTDLCKLGWLQKKKQQKMFLQKITKNERHAF
ncbi:MAG: helicase [Candidatus Yanofskybacteria bacterium CG10_big_fil_rev_8_21_14_0_10_36_16]|uniref:Helicase n=1 Tax=Candidatus Yanofskybacteria bacterium CG10_big_fil_rev_8_21_14_0_10_36_16 TaxID=1975096 RepID=A0A2J0Q8H7_9BACT|nr:MAG: helicase [Candidatus Yanofskybacteria bacterium CG10_big_fil_rev_8_21_14_0_10_36_16]